MAYYCAVAAAAGAIGLSAYHTVFGTMVRHRTLWDTSMDLESKSGYYTCWHIVSVQSIMQAIMYTLPLFKPSLGPALHAGIIFNSITMLISADVALAHAVVHRQPKLMLTQWIGLAALGVLGLVGASAFKL